MLNGGKGVGWLSPNVPWCPFQEGSYTKDDKRTELAIKPHTTRNKLKNTKNKTLIPLQHIYLY